MMRIEANFCVSHGDEMKIVGQVMYINGDSLPFIDMLYQRMGREIGADALLAIERGDLGPNAHLVTHPHDKVES